MDRAGWIVDFGVIALLLGGVAAIAPEPWWPTDRHFYERLGREFPVPGCTDIHCFRVLVPWVLERFPSPSPFFVWRAYAVLCQAGAAVAIGLLVMKLGHRRRTARQIAWMTAFGAGALYTLFDPHTSDPLIHLLAPVTMMLILDRRVRAAGWVSGVGILAKEFAIVPLVVAGVGRALQHRTSDARRLIGAALAVFAVWAIWQVALRLAFGYTLGRNGALALSQGGYVTFWVSNIGPALIAASIVMALGVVWLLWPVGLIWGSREWRLYTLASAPAIAVFCAVQQPERALWNFAFLFMPAVAVVLTRVPPVLAWALVIVHALANLRFGAQLSFVPPSRVTIAVAGVLALLSLVAASSRSRSPLHPEAAA